MKNTNYANSSTSHMNMKLLWLQSMCKNPYTWSAPAIYSMTVLNTNQVASRLYGQPYPFTAILIR